MGTAMPYGRFAGIACQGLWPSDPDDPELLDELLDELSRLAAHIDAELRGLMASTPDDIDALASEIFRFEDLSLPLHPQVLAVIKDQVRQLRRELAQNAASAESACMQIRDSDARSGLDPYGPEVTRKLDNLAEMYRTGGRSLVQRVLIRINEAQRAAHQVDGR
jgi:hypothetical protein